MIAFSSRGLLSTLFILWLQLSPREVCLGDIGNRAVVDTMCVGAGHKNTTFYYSIGQDYLKSPEYYSRGFVRTHNEIWDGGKFRLSMSAHAKIYVIKTGDRYLAGNLAAKFWLNRTLPAFKEADFKFLYIQVEDENAFAIGEFLTSPPCTDNTISPAKVSKLFFTPCAHANPTDQQIPNAFTYIYPSIQRQGTGMVNVEVRTAIEEDLANTRVHEDLFVFWRFSHTSCNKPKKIRVRAFITTDAREGNGPGSEFKDLGRYSHYRSRWFEINWVGAADIVQPHEKDSCELVEIADSDDDKTPAHLVEAPWIKMVEAHHPYGETEFPSWGTQDPSWKEQFCKPIRYGDGYDAAPGNNVGGNPDEINKIPTFLGRCKDGREGGTLDAAKNTYAHACPDGQKGLANITLKYSEYLDKRKSCMGLDDCPCQCRDKFNPYALGKKKRPTCRGYVPGGGVNSTSGKKPLFLGFDTRSPGGVSILTGRRVHGIVMTLVSMTFVPISIMLTRYFKETWLSRSHLQIVQVWYVIHVMLSFFSICLYLMGWIAMWRSIKLLGHSFVWAATYHRLVGRLTILFFALIVLIGSLRPVENSPFRKILMMTHAFSGVLYYFSGMITVVLSQWIPGSPSANDDECIYSQEFFDKSTYSIMPIVVGWIGVDIIFHILFTLFQCILDKRAGYKRPMFIPLLSVLKGGEERSTKGSKLRTLMFIIYCVGNVSVTVTLIIKMLNSIDAGCGFGPTTCTHSNIDTFLPNPNELCRLY